MADNEYEFVMMEPDDVEPPSGIGQPSSIWTTNWSDVLEIVESIRPSLVELMWEIRDELFYSATNPNWVVTNW